MTHYMPTGAPAGGAKAAWARPGFDQAAWEASEAGRNADALQALYRVHADEPMHPEVIAHWARIGIRKELFEPGTPGEYAVFTPLVLDSAKRYPLVYASHGGREPINKTETTGFARLVEREQLIVVHPENGGPSNDAVETEFPRIVGELERHGYPFDPERIYAVGYSAGSDATGVLACAYPEMLAAVSPSPGGNLFAKGRWYASPESTAKNVGLRLPLISVAGTLDGGDRYPLEQAEHVENYDIWMQRIVQVPNYTPLGFAGSVALREADDRATAAFAFRFDRTWQQRLEGLDWLFGDHLDEGGTAIARFVMGAGLPHALTGSSAPLAWDFLRHFRRNRTTGASLHDSVVVHGIESVAALGGLPLLEAAVDA